MHRIHLPTLLFVVTSCLPSGAVCAADAFADGLKQSILRPDEAASQHNEFVLARIPHLELSASAKQWQVDAAQTRQRVLEEVVFRGVPQSWRRPDPTVVWTDEIETDKGYKIRKLRMEALPGLWIPALLYEPVELTGKTPAILNVNGHASTGKSTSYKQLRQIEACRLRAGSGGP